MKALDDLGPQYARRAHLGDLHEVVHADAPEEAEARREAVDIQAGRDARADVLEAVGQRVAQLDIGGGAGFLHVVAADRNAVELRHFRGAVAENVADDVHRGPRRIDVGVADHELFQNVVLNGSAELRGRHALLFGRHDVEGHDGQHRAVHGHGNRHLAERDLVEEDLHVLDRIDGHAGLAHVARLRARCPNRSRDGWPGRRPPRGPSARPPGCGGKRRWTLRRWRSRRTGGWSTAAWRTWWNRGRAGKEATPAAYSRCSMAYRSSAV